ncbi:hypothetical protein J5J10_11130 [Ciceribacter sp. L1K23]|uniref:hypothetical protein n=1 Tax=Ciceribacter sp. L1K23 TaxID=2820276 RepID=UPI001B81563D|nr:hypothetical protein [Ciceribacter sp. L1K23]MBR0556230.1 hypothetical protein [Ciceribacter sp. L1K23]
MLLNWLLIFEHARKRQGARREHPLADPLERPEWQGLGWVVAIFARVSRRRRTVKRAAPERACAPVEDCHVPA